MINRTWVRTHLIYFECHLLRVIKWTSHWPKRNYFLLGILLKCTKYTKQVIQELRPFTPRPCIVVYNECLRAMCESRSPYEKMKRHCMFVLGSNTAARWHTGIQLLTVFNVSKPPWANGNWCMWCVIAVELYGRYCKKSKQSQIRLFLAPRSKNWSRSNFLSSANY